MKKIIVLLLLTSLTACSSIQDVYKYIPSFKDETQNRSMIDVYRQVVNIDCSQPQAIQAKNIAAELQWLQLYSESKGASQHDVLELIYPIQSTTKEWVERARDKDPSIGYCGIKKDILMTQAKKASEALLRRF